VLSSILVVATATRDNWITFVVLFVAEALAWAGVPAIGAAAMGAAGLLAQQGTLHLWAVIVVGTLAAELGGVVGWRLGYRVARGGLHRRGRLADRQAKALDAGEHFAARWGPLVVFLVPSWVSGALGMKLGQFAVWNLLVAFLWVLGAGLGAYGIGSAASGGGLLESLAPLAVAAAAFVAIVCAAVRARGRWRRERHAARPAASRLDPGSWPRR
jgi:membrane protein DedA with SNARE-associated domain